MKVLKHTTTLLKIRFYSLGGSILASVPFLAFGIFLIILSVVNSSLGDLKNIVGFLLIGIGLVVALAMGRVITWTFDKEEGFLLIVSKGLLNQDVLKYRLDEIADISVERGGPGTDGSSIVSTQERLILELKAGYRVPLHPFYEPMGQHAEILADRIRIFLADGGIR